MELLTQIERMTEEKAALENDVINYEMNLQILTVENKRLKAQIIDLKKEIERLEQVIKDKDSLCYDCKKSVEGFAENMLKSWESKNADEK